MGEAATALGISAEVLNKIAEEVPRIVSGVIAAASGSVPTLPVVEGPAAMTEEGKRKSAFEDQWDEYCKWAMADPQGYVDSFEDFTSSRQGVPACPGAPSGDEVEGQERPIAPWQRGAHPEQQGDGEDKDDERAEVESTTTVEQEEASESHKPTVEHAEGQLSNAAIAKLKAAAAGRDRADPPKMKDYLDTLEVDSATLAAQEKQAEKKRKERQRTLGKFGKKLMGDPVPDLPGYYACLDCATGGHAASKTFMGGILHQLWWERDSVVEVLP